MFTVERFGRPSLSFEDLLTFHTRKAEERGFSLGNVEGRDSVARELLCWNTSAHAACLLRF